MTAAIQRHQPGIIDTLVTSEWTRDIIELVRRQTCPKGIPEGEFFIYMKKAQQSGLNPLLGEACCVPRKTKGPNGNEITVFTFQPMAEGMRARAARFPDFKSVDGAAVYEKDLCTVDPGAGTVVHKFNGAAPRGNIVGAWGRVARTDGTAIVAWLPASARVASGPVWGKDPGGHLAKCAMVQALRQAYPVAFGGVYAREEMDDAAPTPTRAEVVMQAASGEASMKDTPALPPPGPAVNFGAFKGRSLAALTAEERAEAVREGEWWLEQNPKAKPKLRDTVRAAVDEVANFGKAPKPEVEDAEELPPAPVSHALTDPSAEPPPGLRLPGEEG